MQAGEIIGDRFELERQAGGGAMGAVWRARDRTTNTTVAIKVLLPGAELYAARFEREAEVLAKLSHDAIVRYIAHGDMGDGSIYLAMEWIDGSTLEERLEKGPLRLGECLLVAAQLSAALGAAHAAGIVHRDVKPANVVLPGDDVARAKLLDFGVARMHAAQSLTMTGMAIGTPGYMAPEQARGQRDVDAPADVFSLGCVLHECVTGMTLFSGEHIAAVLSKVLLEEAPRLAELRDLVPAELDVLVARMLTKSATGRPPNGEAVAAEIEAIRRVIAPSSLAMVAPPRTSAEPGAASLTVTSLSRDELGIASVILVAGQPALDASDVERLRGRPELRGARLDLLADGSLLALTAPPQASLSAKDTTAAAARCALALSAAMPLRRVSLATGPASMTGPVPIGEAIDMAARLVGHATQPGIRVDETTAGLLGQTFELVRDGTGWALQAEIEREPNSRFLGRRVPCVGRERELAVLDGLYEQCTEDSVARAVVLLAGPGMGKSRLVREFLERCRQHGHAPIVWLGRANPINAGSALAVLADALRRDIGLAVGAPLDVRRAKVEAAVRAHTGDADARRIGGFLGELLGVSSDSVDHPQLAAARLDPALMADQMRRAFQDYVVGATSHRPVILVLEDLQWGDVASVSFVESALRMANARPFLVVATGRPETHDRFPDLWAERGAEELRVRELTRRAGETLVRATLEQASADVVERIVARADGNPLFLEELVRAESEGRSEELPGSILAIVVGRLEKLLPEERRVLRGASVFGAAFWRGGLLPLLGGDEGLVDAALDRLGQRGLIARAADDESRIAGEPEYEFVQEVTREAAYGMLTDDDRRLGHRAVAAWLERTGETDALLLAVHWHKAGDLQRASAAYVHAAEAALEANDLAGAVTRAEMGLQCAPDETSRVRLRIIATESWYWQGDYGEASNVGELALAELPEADAAWPRLAGVVATVRVYRGDIEGAEELAERIMRAARAGDPERAMAFGEARIRLARHLTFVGRRELADALLTDLPAARTPSMLAHEHLWRAIRGMQGGETGLALAEYAAATNLFTEIGDARWACNGMSNIAAVLNSLGDYVGAEGTLRKALVEIDRLDARRLLASTLTNLAYAVGRQGRGTEACEIFARGIAAGVREGDRRSEGAGRGALALLLTDLGHLEDAEAEGTIAVALLRAAAPPFLPFALGALARVVLARGRTDEAVELAREGTQRADAEDAEEGDALVRLVYAEALAAHGDMTKARAVIAVARDRVRERAAQIANEELREGYLTRVSEHTRTFELADTWKV